MRRLFETALWLAVSGGLIGGLLYLAVELLVRGQLVLGAILACSLLTSTVTATWLGVLAILERGDA